MQTPGMIAHSGMPALERLVVLRPVEHGAPALGVGVAEPDELQAGRGQHGEDGVEPRNVATMSEVIVGMISATMM